jgi:methylase of polypeptide subunit release factors
MRDDVLRVIAHDAFPVDAEGNRLPLPEDFVMGVGGATRTLLDLLPPGHVGRALDVGCGSGALTVFLDADRVIATDIAPRALEAAGVTCHISGFRKLEPHVWREGHRLIEFRQGSLLEPVQGQRFDLIVSNPPFVIGGVGHTHRDSPFEADGLTRALLEGIPPLLNNGGRAIVLASWLHVAGEDWQDRIAEWLPQDVSAWVAQREYLDLDAYVDVWSADAGLAGADRTAWRERLSELGAEGVGFGWVILERGPSVWRVIEDVSAAPRIPKGREVTRQLAAFAAEPTAVALLHGQLQFSDTHWRGDLTLDPFVAALLEHVRAGRTLDAAIELVAGAMPVDADDLMAHALQFARSAVQSGYLAFTPAP